LLDQDGIRIGFNKIAFQSTVEIVVQPFLVLIELLDFMTNKAGKLPVDQFVNI
jgi:hypothetical protein